MALGYASILTNNYSGYGCEFLEFLSKYKKFEYFDMDFNILKNDEYSSNNVELLFLKKCNVRLHIDHENISIIELTISKDKLIISEFYSLDQIDENQLEAFESLLKSRFSMLQKKNIGFGYIFDPFGYSEDYFGLNAEMFSN